MFLSAKQSALNDKLKSVLRFLVFLGIGVGILYWLYTSQEAAYADYCQLQGIPDAECDFAGKLLSDFKSVKPFWIFLVLIFYMISNLSRVLRWRMMMNSLGHPIKFGTAFIAVMTGYFANSVIPRSGELVRAGYASYKTGTPLEKVLGTIVLGRSIDFLSLGIVIALGFILEFDILYGYVSENLGDPREGLLGNPLVWAVGVVGIITLVLAFIFREKLRQNKIFRIFEEKLKGFKDGIVSFKYVKNKPLFIFHSLVIWVMYYLMTYVGFFSFGATENLSAVTGLVVFVFGTLGIVIPSPGGLGAYQFLVTTCLNQFYNLDYSDAFSYSNIAFWPIYILNIVIGFILLPFVAGFLFKKKDKENT